MSTPAALGFLIPKRNLGVAQKKRRAAQNYATVAQELEFFDLQGAVSNTVESGTVNGLAVVPREAGMVENALFLLRAAVLKRLVVILVA